MLVPVQNTVAKALGYLDSNDRLQLRV